MRHFLGPPESAAELAPYVESVNGALATAIAGAAVQSPSDDSNLTPDGTASVSAVRVVSPVVATVDFGISDSGSDNYVQRFVGDVIATGGRWKLSWATVCMLVEAERYVCPNPPAPLPGAVPLHHSLQGDTKLAHQVPDLVRPQALAVLPGGDLLIVDSDRDQILRWQPDGSLSVFAGTGQPGASGIGGPAVDARLPPTSAPSSPSRRTAPSTRPAATTVGCSSSLPPASSNEPTPSSATRPASPWAHQGPCT